MSARSTTTPSLAHTYCCFGREPQPACTMLKEMPAEDWVAEKSLTGTDTRPKVKFRDAMERAAIVVNSLQDSGSGRGRVALSVSLAKHRHCRAVPGLQSRGENRLVARRRGPPRSAASRPPRSLFAAASRRR